MLVAQNSLGPVCPVPLTVRGNWSAPAASPDARERGFDRDDYSAEDDLCKGVRRMSTTPQKVPERAPFRHYSYRDADERPPAWQRKSAF